MMAVVLVIGPHLRGGPAGQPVRFPPWAGRQDDCAADVLARQAADDEARVGP